MGYDDYMVDMDHELEEGDILDGSMFNYRFLHDFDKKRVGFFLFPKSEYNLAMKTVNAHTLHVQSPETGKITKFNSADSSFGLKHEIGSSNVYPFFFHRLINEYDFSPTIKLKVWKIDGEHGYLISW